jgi:hypothetical protein
MEYPPTSPHFTVRSTVLDSRGFLEMDRMHFFLRGHLIGDSRREALVGSSAGAFVTYSIARQIAETSETADEFVMRKSHFEEK